MITNLEKYLDTYGNAANENAIANIDVDIVLRDIASNIIEPNTDDEEINNLYQRGIALNKDITVDILPKLRSLKEEKLHQIYQFIDQLNLKLNKDYEDEVRRGIDYGIYDKNEKQLQK